jgi:glycosyltransferase involved in cell wall biosynthesis
MTQTRVCIFHNIVAPYRLPLFERLSKDYELSVLFGLDRPPDRLWTASLIGVSFSYRVLRAWRLGRLVLNPTLPIELIRRRPEVVIHADSDESLVSLITILIVRRLMGYQLVVWVEHVQWTTAALRSTRSSRSRLGWLFTKIALRSMSAIRRFVYRRADALLSMSGAASDSFISSFRPTCPVFTGTQIMPRSVLPPPPSPSGITDHDGRLRVLFLGYLRPNKNVDSLILAFARSTSGSEELVIAGSGPELEHLKSLAAGVGNVTFAGYVDGEAKAAVFSEADLFVVPSFVEPWGLTVNEALFYGVPVLVSSGAASSTLIAEGRTGLVFDPSRQDDLEAHLRQFFESVELRERLRAGVAEADMEVVVGIEHGVKHFQMALSALADGRRHQ